MRVEDGGMAATIGLVFIMGGFIGTVLSPLFSFIHPLALAITMGMGALVVFPLIVPISKRVIANTINSLDKQIDEKETRLQEISE